MVAVAAALVAAPALRADDGATAAADATLTTPAAASASPATGTDQASAAVATPSEAPGRSEAAPSGNGPEIATAAAGGGDAALAQAAPGPGNGEAAPRQSDPAPGNSDGAPGQSDPGPGNSDAAPGHSDAEQGASIAQGADASANGQQNGVGNTKVDVRVDTPGNGPPVAQENRSEGNAEATAAAETSSPATSDQSAAAAAEAAQVDVQNTAVTVRVGSAGDNGTVDQMNVAAATASTTVAAPADGQSTVDESASAAATQDGVVNTSVSIRVFSPGDDAPVTQTNEAAAAAETSGDDGATATAAQNDVQNTRVSVRIESGGTLAAVSQQSATSATAGSAAAPGTGSGVAVATTGNGIDTDLSVVVDGDGLDQPGANGLQVWIWTWNWDRNESDAIGSSLDAQPSSWDWVWGSGPGQIESGTATQAPQPPGSWTWNWDWAREGAPDWTWNWDWTAVLPCSSCVWIWNWNWNWTGQPAPTGATAPPTGTPDRSGTQQANLVVANADATVTAEVTQTIGQTGDGEQYAGQLASVEQHADATAVATQWDVQSVATADLLTPQSNRVLGHASVTVSGDLVQRVEQTMLVDGDGTAAQWSGQQIDLVQDARADVRAKQDGLSPGRAGTHVASALASAEAVAGVDQDVLQVALVDGGATDQWAGQLTLVEQAGAAVSVVEQTDAEAPGFVGGTARARSASGAVALVDQDVAQGAVRGGGLGSQTAMQTAYVGQTGVASATTSQRAGGASSPVASSDASATNRALVVQVGLQEGSGAVTFDVQDLTQQSIVVQHAVAVSTSAGGIAGSAVVVNCAVVEQTAAQSLAGGSTTASSATSAAFCTPPSAAPGGGTSDEAVLLSGTPTVLSVALAAEVAPPPADSGVALFHGRPSAAKPTARERVSTPRATRATLVRSEPGVGRPLTGAPQITQISVPRPTQARLDTRPGDQAGAGDAGREPPLPPAGGPPLRVSALAAAVASGAGPSGIAAILLAFALVPPLLVRAREGSVVRRPVGVLSRVDVPV